MDGDAADKTDPDTTQPEELTYSLALSSSQLTFGPFETESSSSPDKSLTVTNSGTGSIAVTKPVIQGDVACVTVDGAAQTTLNPGDSVTYQVAPVSGLGIGSYANTLVIRSDHDVSVSATASFEVTQPEESEPMLMSVAFVSPNALLAEAPVLAAPLAASNISLSAESTGYNSVRLSWGSVTDATRYQVRSAGSSSDNFVTIAETSELSYSHTGLTCGAEYYYRVAAIDSDGNEIGLSGIKFAKPIPAEPSGLDAVSASYSSISITWNAVAGASGYEIYRDGVLIRTQSARAYTDTGLTTGTSYGYTVRAYRAMSPDVYGDFAYAACIPVCSAPTNVRAVSTGSTSVTVSWNAALGADGYALYYSDDASTSAPALASDSISSSPYEQVSLITGTEYHFFVKAYVLVNGAKLFSDASASASATPLPTAPSSIAAVSMSDASIKITWSVVQGASGYKIYRSDTSNVTASDLLATVRGNTNTSYTNEGLVTGQRYYYKVSAYVTVLGNDVNGALTAQNGYAAPRPKTPTGFSVVSENSNAMRLTWNAVPGATSYNVYRSLTADGSYSKIHTTTGTSYTNVLVSTGVKLVPGCMYYYKLCAVAGASGQEVYSDETTPIGRRLLPAEPVLNSATAAAYDSATLKWEAVTNAVGYKLYYSTAENGAYTLAKTVVGINTTTGVINGLTTGTEYYFKVRAYVSYNGVNYDGGYSNILSFEPRPGKSATPTIAVASIDDRTINISWLATPGASGYRLYGSEASSGAYTLLDEGLANCATTRTLPYYGTTYNYKVAAYVTNEAGNELEGALSNERSILLRPTTPAKPSAASASPTSVKVTWSKIANVDACEISYRIVGEANWTVAATITQTNVYSYECTGLSTGENYEFSIRGRYNGKTTYQFTGRSTVVTATPVPGSPRDLKATSVNVTTLDLTWTPDTRASGYVLYHCSTAGGTYTRVATINDSSVSSYRLANRAAGVTMYYRIRAYTDTQSGRFYARSSAAVAGTPVPGKPTITAATPASAFSITVTWKAAAGATQYVVYVSQDKDSGYTKAATTSSLSATVDGLALGRTYYFRVYGFVNNSPGGASNTVSCKAAFPAPKNLAAKATNYQTLTLSWTGVGGAQSYVISWVDPVTGADKTASTTGTSYNLRVVPEYPYELSVHARLVWEGVTYNGAESATVKATTHLAAPTVTLSSRSSSRTDVTWTKIAGAVGYRVYRSTSKSSGYGSPLVTSNDPSVCSYVDTTALEPGKIYYYKVCGMTANGKQAPCNAGKAVRCRPNVPTGIKASQRSYNSLAVSWNAVSSAQSYYLYRATSANGSYAQIAVVSGTSYNDLRLQLGTTYYYKVRACVKVGTASSMSLYSAVASGAPKLSKPGNLGATRSGNVVTFTWKAPAGAVYYNIYGTLKSGTTKRLASRVTGTSRRVTLPSDVSKYSRFTIRAYRVVNGVTYQSDAIQFPLP